MRRLTMALVALGAGAAGGLGAIAPVSAGTAFDGVARGDALTVYADNPGYFPLDARADPGAPTAQVRLSSGGTSTALASSPYPGEFLSAVPGLAASQGAPGVSYPATVQASHPNTPEAVVGSGPYRLSARARQHGAAAEARSGADGGDAGGYAVGLMRSTAEVTQAAGAVVASATGLTEGFSLGPLRVGRVHAEATVRSVGGELRRESDLAVEGASVAGQQVQLTPEGLVVGPAATPIPDSPLGDVLAEYGITVDYVAARSTPSGVVAPTLTVSVRRPTPGSVGGTPRATFTLASAVAFVDATVVRDPGSGGAGGAAAGSGAAGDAGGDGSGGTTGAIGGPTPTGSLAGPPVSGGATGTGPTTPVVDPGSPRAAVNASTTFGQLDELSAYWYLALVVAAGTALAASHLLRKLGLSNGEGVRS